MNSLFSSNLVDESRLFEKSWLFLILRLINNLAYLFTEEFVVDNIYGKFYK